jgi:arsenite-transporting ATPase
VALSVAIENQKSKIENLRCARPATLPPSAVSLLLFAGKGGVGKTTLASATALRLAQEYPGKQVLLFSTDPAHSLSDCLDLPIGPRETPVAPGLTALEIDAEAEFSKLRALYAADVAALFSSLTGGASLDLAFDHEVIESVLDLSPPGLDEVMALTRAMELLESGKYDILVLDAPPTGHLVRLLELPDLIRDWLKMFFGLFLKYKSVLHLPATSDLLVTLSKRLKSLRSILADPEKGQLYAVSILTEMSREETWDLLAACRRMGVHVPALFLNLATPPSDCPLCQALAQAETQVRRCFEDAFAGLQQPVVYRCGDLRGVHRLAELGQAIYHT